MNPNNTLSMIILTGMENAYIALIIMKKIDMEVWALRSEER